MPMIPVAQDETLCCAAETSHARTPNSIRHATNNNSNGITHTEISADITAGDIPRNSINPYKSTTANTAANTDDSAANITLGERLSTESHPAARTWTSTTHTTTHGSNTTMRGTVTSAATTSGAATYADITVEFQPNSPPAHAPPPPTNNASEADTPHAPIIPAIRRLFRNAPYVRYLLFRIPMTLAALLPSSLLPDFIKYVMQLENWPLTLNLGLGITILSIFVSIPLLISLSRRYGKREVLTVACIIEGIVFCGSFFLEPKWVLDSGMLYLLSVFVGLGMAASFVLPDSMLGDVIDYDEMVHGVRSEGLYTVVETNLQQFVEIVGGVLPALISGAYGFETLGGCTCGCGVKCGVDYLRWQCRDDVGYACTSSFSAPPFYGDVHRHAPCAQQPENVQFVLRVFTIGLPGVLYLLAAPAAWHMAIGSKQHADILAGTRALRDDPSALVEDPLTRRPVLRAAHSRTGLIAEHFSAFEVGLTRAQVQPWLVGRLASWVAILTGLVVIIVASGNNVSVVTLVSFTFAALALLVPWDVARLLLLISLTKAEADAVFAGKRVRVRSCCGDEASRPQRGHPASLEIDAIGEMGARRTTNATNSINENHGGSRLNAMERRDGGRSGYACPHGARAPETGRSALREAPLLAGSHSDSRFFL